jgi:hypothetical protein
MREPTTHDLVPETASSEELPNPYTRLTAVDAVLQRTKFLLAELVAHQGEPMAGPVGPGDRSTDGAPSEQLAAILSEITADLHGALMGPLPVVSQIAVRRAAPWLHRWTQRLWPIDDVAQAQERAEQAFEDQLQEDRRRVVLYDQEQPDGSVTVGVRVEE